MPAAEEVDEILAEFQDDVALAQEVVRLREERDRYRSAMDEIDQMDPEDFKGGQEHLPPAFRQPNLKDAFRHVCRIVNGVLHGTDEYGRPLP